VIVDGAAGVGGQLPGPAGGVSELGEGDQEIAGALGGQAGFSHLQGVGVHGASTQELAVAGAGSGSAVLGGEAEGCAEDGADPVADVVVEVVAFLDELPAGGSEVAGGADD